MSNVTLRFLHRPTYTPVIELEPICATATIGDLKALLLQRLATEEQCLMRVFVKWHAQVEAAGRKRLIELTDQDIDVPLSAIGLTHLSEVHLEGPLLTGDTDGACGQLIAIVIQRMETQSRQTNKLLYQLLEAQKQRTDYLLDKVHLSERVQLSREAEEAQGKLFSTMASELAKLHTNAYESCPKYFTFDRSHPYKTVKFSDDRRSATKVVVGGVCYLRSSLPLSAGNHRWSVRVDRTDANYVLRLGLLPRLFSDDQFKMESESANAINGYFVTERGISGEWECPPMPFKQGDTVTFDYNVAARKLTISIDGRTVVGQLHSAYVDDKLYPAMYLSGAGQKVSFV